MLYTTLVQKIINTGGITFHARSQTACADGNWLLILHKNNLSPSTVRF